MIGRLGLLAATTATRVPTPKVDWKALAPIVILLVGGIVLLTVASLTPTFFATSASGRGRASIFWRAAQDSCGLFA